MKEKLMTFKEFTDWLVEKDNEEMVIVEGYTDADLRKLYFDYQLNENIKKLLEVLKIWIKSYVSFVERKLLV